MKNIVKTLIITFVTILSFILISFGWIYYEFMYKPARDAGNLLLKQNPQVTRVYSMEKVSGWGSLPEYTVIIKVDHEKCRVWTDESGDILSSECKAKIK